MVSRVYSRLSSNTLGRNRAPGGIELVTKQATVKLIKGAFVTANLIDGNKAFMRVIRVPVEFDSVPQLPSAIALNGGEMAVLRKNNPATYAWVGKPRKELKEKNGK